MSDLQLALIVLGAVFVAAVAGYNVLQERRARRRAEAAFRGTHSDALLDPVDTRREPVLGALPGDVRDDPALGALDEVIEPGDRRAGRGIARGGASPAASTRSRSCSRTSPSRARSSSRSSTRCRRTPRP